MAAAELGGVDERADGLQGVDDAVEGGGLAGGVGGDENRLRAEGRHLAQQHLGFDPALGCLRGAVDDDGAGAGGGGEDEREAIERGLLEHGHAQRELRNRDTGDRHAEPLQATIPGRGSVAATSPLD